MSSSGFSMSATLDSGSMGALVRMAGFQALLMPEILAALTESGTLVVQTAQDLSYSLFQNPSGAFADSLYFWVVSPEEVAVGAGVPYAQRLEYGFSGMTDSLGRYYPYWPDYHWAQQTLDAVQPEVELIMAEAVGGAIGAIGGA
jgi:hypothetical protein